MAQEGKRPTSRMRGPRSGLTWASVLIYATVTAGLLVLGEAGVRRLLWRHRVSRARVDRAFREVREATACEGDAFAKGEPPPPNCPAAAVRAVVAQRAKVLEKHKKRWVRPLDVLNQLRYPLRIAEGPKGLLYVTDAMVGSVFILNRQLKPVGELKGLDRPLGVVVTKRGWIYVGNDGRDNVEVYNRRGRKLGAIGAGTLRMPNDLALDSRGRLYVVDSLSNVVRVFDARGRLVRNIGGPGDGIGGLSFPCSVAIVSRSDSESGTKTTEVCVADQGHKKIQIFDLKGNFLRAYDEQQSGGVFGMGMGWGSTPLFVRLQALAVDGEGQLHAIDCYTHKVTVLDVATGQVLGSYGEFGSGPGQLKLPLDIYITRRGDVVVANAENHRVEFIEAGP